jgi:polysaccharide chain length determinant protein (PEP-CTERM system associated)
MPKIYMSSTKIWVEAPKIRESAVKGTSQDGGYSAPSLEERVVEIRGFLIGRKVLSQVADQFKLYDYESSNPESPKSENAIRGLRGGIKVEGAKDKTHVVVSFLHEDPAMAQGVTARLAELLVEETQREKEEGYIAAEEFLDNELVRAKAELEAKEKVISHFKQEHLGELPQQLEANLRTLDRLQADMKSQNELAQGLQDRLAMQDKAIRLYEETGDTNELSEMSGPGAKRKADPRLARIKELERQLVVLSAMYKETYPDLVQVKEELKKLKEMTTAQYRDLLPDSDEADDIGVSRKSKKKPTDPYHAELLKRREEIVLELDAIKRRQGRISVEMAQYDRRVQVTPDREQKLKTLERDYENMQKNYQSLLDKKLNAAIAGNLEKRRKGSRYSIVDPAYKPVIPVVPNIPIVLMAGLAVGCALGFGGAIGLEMIGKGFRSAEEVEVSLGLPVIASIPLYESAFGGLMKSVRALPKRPDGVPLLGGSIEKAGRDFIPAAAGASRLKVSDGATHQVQPGMELVAMWRPLSFVAEQYRVAATRLELMGGERKSSVVVVTSAVMGEGKSSTALNLGYVLAKDLDRRTIVVDCDFKRPMQHIYAGVWQQPGVADILRGNKPINDCLQRLGEGGPWVLTAGSVTESPLALSKIQQIGELLNELREQFEYIIVDAPPVLPLADMHVLASSADVLAYVIKANMTGRDVVQKALKALSDTSNVGVILNGLDAHTTPYYMQQDYYREAYREARHEQVN